jgi:phage terminase large subunit GpA-like protein
MRAFDDPRYRRVVLCCGAQMGKTDALLDLIGERLDDRPVPILYVAPSKEFCTDQFEPRLVELFRQSTSLAGKVLGGLVLPACGCAWRMLDLQLLSRAIRRGLP